MRWCVLAQDTGHVHGWTLFTSYLLIWSFILSTSEIHSSEIQRQSVSSARSDTIAGILRRAVSRYPSKLAIEFEGRNWTFSEMEEAVHRVAKRLVGAGLEQGSRVVSFAGNSDAYVLLFFACAQAGLVHVPLNYSLKGDELGYVLNDADASLVVADPEMLAVLEDVPGWGGSEGSQRVWPMVPTTSQAARSVLETALETSTECVNTGVDGSDLMQLQYTSGTTSAPKGAMMSHTALTTQYASAIIALDFESTDRVLMAMPLYHSGGMHSFMIAHLAVGATVHLLKKPDIPTLLRRIEQEHINSLFLAPTVWVRLSSHEELDQWDLSSLKKAQYGGSIMPVTVLNRLRSKFPEIGFYNVFGLSEMGPLSAVLRPEDHADRPGSIGRPVFFVETRVVTHEGKLAAPGEPGEMQFRSPQLMLGYWNKPEETAEAFVDGWFRTGDQVIQDADGFLEVVDRIKDVINTGGVLVAPREIEDVIFELDEVADAAVVGVPDEEWIEAIRAFVILKEDASLTDDALRSHVRKRLARHKVPKSVLFVEDLPRNPSGKLLKRQLR